MVGCKAVTLLLRPSHSVALSNTHSVALSNTRTRQQTQDQARCSIRPCITRAAAGDFVHFVSFPPPFAYRGTGSGRVEVVASRQVFGVSRAIDVINGPVSAYTYAHTPQTQSFVISYRSVQTNDSQKEKNWCSSNKSQAPDDANLNTSRMHDCGKQDFLVVLEF